MELRTYLEILWRREWVIGFTAVTTLAAVVLGTLLATPIYAASATLRVATAAGGPIDYANYMYAERLMNTQAKIATSRPVLEELAVRLGLDGPPQIEVEIEANTELMRITVEDPDPSLAREAANTLAEILVAKGRELYSGGGRPATEILSEQLAQVEEELNQARGQYESLLAQSSPDSERITALGQSIAFKEETHAMLLEQYEQARVRSALQANTLSVVEPAVTPLVPSQPRMALNIALGALVGLAGGVGLAFLFENLDTTLYTTGQIEAATELATLGQIPAAIRQRGMIVYNGDSAQAEAFRCLRTSIFALDGAAPLQTLLVTSAEPGEGKSTVVANLAVSIAQSGRRVIAVDADLRRPSLHKIFDMSNEIGLSNVLTEAITANDIASSLLTVLASGPRPSNPTELLGSTRMLDLLKQLMQRFDVVLLDTPSLVSAGDAAVLAPMVDAVLLVIGRGQARREAVHAACQQLVAVKARSVHLIVNRAEADGRYSHHDTG